MAMNGSFLHRLVLVAPFGPILTWESRSPRENVPRKKIPCSPVWLSQTLYDSLWARLAAFRRVLLLLVQFVPFQSYGESCIMFYDLFYSLNVRILLKRTQIILNLGVLTFS